MEQTGIEINDNIDEDEHIPFIMAHATGVGTENSLENYLRSRGHIENSILWEHRQAVINELIELITEQRSSNKVLISGSSSLGLCLTDCDVDLLVLSPLTENEEKEKFFDCLRNCLSNRGIETRLSSTPAVMVMAFFYGVPKVFEKGQSTNNSSLYDSTTSWRKKLKVDVVYAKMKTVFDKINIDESPVYDIVALSHKISPAFACFFLPRRFCEGSDVHSLRSFSAFRTMIIIKKLVKNLEAFRVALVFVKLWAKHNRIYGNYGVFGGIVWTVMLAKVSMQFPYANASKLIYLFFLLYSDWPWPKPVVLFPLDDGPNFVSPTDQLLYLDKTEYLMPVIAPVYPYENMTKLVDKISAERIKAALADGFGSVGLVFSDSYNWSAFFN